MKRKPVESSNILAVGYNREKAQLEIEFKRSKVVYKYFDVPANVHRNLMKAESIGSYFNQNIAKEYEFVRL